MKTIILNNIKYEFGCCSNGGGSVNFRLLSVFNIIKNQSISIRDRKSISIHRYDQDCALIGKEISKIHKQQEAIANEKLTNFCNINSL